MYVVLSKAASLGVSVKSALIEVPGPKGKKPRKCWANRKHENAQSQSPKGAEFAAFPKGRQIGQPKQRHDH